MYYFWRAGKGYGHAQYRKGQISRRHLLKEEKRIAEQPWTSQLSRGQRWRSFPKATESSSSLFFFFCFFPAGLGPWARFCCRLRRRRHRPLAVVPKSSAAAAAATAAVLISYHLIWATGINLLCLTAPRRPPAPPEENVLPRAAAARARPKVMDFGVALA